MHNANISFSMENKITIENYENFVLVHQSEGPTLGFCPTSGVKIIYRDGVAFKSFDGSDTLLPYEDWRLPAEVRAEDLSRRLSIDEIAGLMLYSRQNKLPMPDDTYSGKPFAESGKKQATSATDNCNSYLKIMCDTYLYPLCKALKWQLNGIIMCNRLLKGLTTEFRQIILQILVTRLSKMLNFRQVQAGNYLCGAT